MTAAGVGLSFVDVAYLYAFGSAGLAVLVVLLGFMLWWQRVDARREALLSGGTRVPATLVSSRATNHRINNRAVLAHIFESGSGIRAQARGFAHLPAGTAATIAYDPARPAHAVVVEDLDQLRPDVM